MEGSEQNFAEATEEQKEEIILGYFFRAVHALERISGSLDVLAQAKIVESGGDVSRSPG